jgi:hypothetical protein
MGRKNMEMQVPFKIRILYSGKHFLIESKLFDN